MISRAHRILSPTSQASLTLSLSLLLTQCGLELVSDLLLVDGLLRIVKDVTVRLHAKDRPVFVSDGTIPDLEPTLKWLEEQGGTELASRLRAAMGEGLSLIHI